MQEKIALLESLIAAHSPMIVAYSGGVDSACLLAMAKKVLGSHATGVIADSPSLPRHALAQALRNAKSFGVDVEIIHTQELTDPHYQENAPNRCYFCKSELFQKMEDLAAERGFAALAYGENADDPPQLRPGSLAAKEFHVLAPLKQAGLVKAEVRALARQLGLPNADIPAQPCLSSRIPHGTPVTLEALGFIERGENALRKLGFRIFRVRFIGGTPPSARIQACVEEQETMHLKEKEVRATLLETGFKEVIFDPNPLRASASA